MLNRIQYQIKCRAYAQSMNNVFHNSQYRMSTNKTSKDNGGPDPKTKEKQIKPNLRDHGFDKRQSRFTLILVACGLIAMYPMVFRPMFFSQEIGMYFVLEEQLNEQIPVHNNIL